MDEFVATLADWAPPAAHFTLDHGSDAGPLEYYTGLARSELDAFGFLPEASSDPAVDPLAQVVRDLTRRTSTGPAQSSIVRNVRATAQSAAHDWWKLRRKLIASGTSFEQEGYDGARTVRNLLGLDGQPIPDVENLLSELDITVARESPAADADRMVVVGDAASQALTMVLANVRTATPWGRRFELARALGHLVLDPLRGEAIGAASGPHAVSSRRRRSGAFAAEFLLPTPALEEASHGVLDGIAEGGRFAELLERYGVGASTAAFQLWNQRFVSSAEIRDDLIAGATSRR